mgnify:FL=1
MAKIALIESKPSRNDYVRLFDNEIQFDKCELCSDRTVKTTFTIKLLGHIVPDSINATVKGMNKFYSKAALNFGFEMVSDI